MIFFTPKISLPLGPITIYTHGLMIAVGMLVGFFLLRREIKKKAPPDLNAFDSCVGWSLLGGIIGSRLLYVFLNLYLFENWVEVFKLWEGGLISFGGLIGGYLTAVFYLKLKKKEIWPWFDISAPYLFLGWGIARIGDFISWGEIGAPTKLFWGVVVEGDVARHPAQLYSTVVLLLTFFIFIKLRQKIKIKGMIFSLALIGYGLKRFLMEFARDYPDSEYLFDYGLFAQGMSLIMVVAGIILIVHFLRSQTSR